MNPAPTQYRFDHYEDEYGTPHYFLVYLSHKTWLFGLMSKSKWKAVPVATNRRALGCETTIEGDCVNGNTIGEMKKFVDEYPDVYKYYFTKYIPKMNELIDKWVNIKATDEDEFDREVDALGIVLT